MIYPKMREPYFCLELKIQMDTRMKYHMEIRMDMFGCVRFALKITDYRVVP